MPTRPNGVTFGAIARRINREGLKACALAGGLNESLIARAIGTRDDPESVLIVSGEGFGRCKQAAGTFKRPQKVRIAQAQSLSSMCGNV